LKIIQSGIDNFYFQQTWGWQSWNTKKHGQHHIKLHHQRPHHRFGGKSYVCQDNGQGQVECELTDDRVDSSVIKLLVQLQGKKHIQFTCTDGGTNKLVCVSNDSNSNSNELDERMNSQLFYQVMMKAKRSTIYAKRVTMENGFAN
jgi:hypothetical protein